MALDYRSEPRLPSDEQQVSSEPIFFAASVSYPENWGAADSGENRPKAVVATSSISNEHRYPRKWQSLREPDYGRGTKGAPPYAFHLSDSFRNPAGKTCRAI